MQHMQHMQHMQMQHMQQMQQMHLRHSAGALSPLPMAWFATPGKHCARTQALLDSNSQMIMRLAEALAIDDERVEGAEPTPEQVDATKAVVLRVRKNVDMLVSAAAEAVRTRTDCKASAGATRAVSDDERILIMLGYATKMPGGDMRLRTALLQSTERLCMGPTITKRRRELFDVLSCLLQRDMEAPAVHKQVIALLADLISDLQRDTFEVRTYMKRAQDLALRPRDVTESKIQAHRDGADPVASRYPQFFAGKHAGNFVHASTNAFMTGRPLPGSGENSAAGAAQNGAVALRLAGASSAQQQQQQMQQQQTGANSSSHGTVLKQLPRFEPSSSRECNTYTAVFGCSCVSAYDFTTHNLFPSAHVYVYPSKLLSTALLLKIRMTLQQYQQLAAAVRQTLARKAMAHAPHQAVSK